MRHHCFEPATAERGRISVQWESIQSRQTCRLPRGPVGHHPFGGSRNATQRLYWPSAFTSTRNSPSSASNGFVMRSPAQKVSAAGAARDAQGHARTGPWRCSATQFVLYVKKSPVVRPSPPHALRSARSASAGNEAGPGALYLTENEISVLRLTRPCKGMCPEDAGARASRSCVRGTRKTLA